MAVKKIRMTVPFDSLVEAINELSAKDKRRLWRKLDEELALAEEEEWEKDPAVAAEIAEARAAYKRGDYITLDEYAASKEQQA